jgi:hypothetical protein
MIITKLYGGLGNQMFQYAAGRRLAAVHDTQLKMDRSWFNADQGPNPPAIREYELECFVLAQNFTSTKDLARIDLPGRSLQGKLYRKVAGPIKLFRESETAEFYPEVLKAPNDSCLDGYWQTEKYFADKAELIRTDFNFKAKASGKNLELARQISSVNSVSLHVRRGDYASNPQTKAFHGLTSLQYYQTTVEKISKQVDSPHFFVFSDDPDWTKKNIKIAAPTTYIGHNKKGFEDLRLMSLCKHHIIANSSFSWWGAWLNPSPDKIVYAPRVWFANSKIDIKDRLPSSWIKI